MKICGRILSFVTMRKTLLLCLVTLPFLVAAQDYELKSTPEVYAELKKLHRGLRVLYIAAHPDDENTRLIAWLENSQHIETAYLSLTRGEGGQNLIGDEKGDALGVVRTYELLGARAIDGGEQFFTRAIDFGYSKSAEESFEKWGKQEILADVVYVVRKFRPHVIITRFPSSEYSGHGHHQASAILAEEAFAKAGDAKAFPGQLTAVQVWQPEVLYHNASTWWRKDLDQKTAEQLTKEKIHKVDVGVFDPITGKAVNEIASLARSMHRCQAFGTWRERGQQFEYLRLVKGEWKGDLFDSMQGVWAQSPAHKEALEQVIAGYDFTNQTKNLDLLNRHFAPRLAQRNIWADPADMLLVNRAIDRIKLAMMGVRVEVFADRKPVAVGAEYKVKVQVYNSAAMTQTVVFTHHVIDTTLEIEAYTQAEWEETLVAPDAPSSPFWLENAQANLYAHDKKMLGEPRQHAENIPFAVKGISVANSATELHRKWRDSSVGEVVQPMLFVPPVAINPAAPSLIGKKGEAVKTSLELVANSDISGGEFRVHVPAVWAMEYDRAPVHLKAGQRKTIEVSFTFNGGAEGESTSVRAPEGDPVAGDVVIHDDRAKAAFSLTVEGKEHRTSATDISYAHIPNTTIHRTSEMWLAPVDITLTVGKKILYIEGSGDEVDETLERIGYRVERRPLAGITLAELQQYDAVVTGIRAYNTNAELAANNGLLLDYVKNGGRMIVQYNTERGLLTENIGPYSFTLSNQRVTEEEAEADILVKNHPIFTTPNALSKADWRGWTQERGLYFAGKWDDRYTPLIAWHDKGEKLQKGALLVAKHGEGVFIYTGISFFRQLPAGVSGAYRLFVNLIEFE